MSEQIKRISPEINSELYERIKVVAEKEKRSVKGQLEHFIEYCLDKYLTEQETKHA